MSLYTIPATASDPSAEMQRAISAPAAAAVPLPSPSSESPVSSIGMAMLRLDSLRNVEVVSSPDLGTTFIVGSFPVARLDVARYKDEAALAAAGVGPSIGRAEAHASSVALAFMHRFAPLFDVQDPSAEGAVESAEIDEIGMAHVTIRQRHRGVPVYQGLAKIHISADGETVEALTNEFRADVEVESIVPRITPEAAEATGLSLLRGEVVDGPELVIYQDASDEFVLSWLVEIRDLEAGQANIYVISAEDGSIIAVIDQVRDIAGRSRRIYDANLDNVLPGTARRFEGWGATGIFDVDAAYSHLGAVYNYFWNNHGWDFGVGTSRGANLGRMLTSVRYRSNPSEPYRNAYWDGSWMVFGEGNATRDIVAHEVGHAITQHTGAMRYVHQIGAVNESCSDVWGYFLDPWDTTIGEGSGLGVIRDLQYPTRHDQPAHTDNYVETCSDCGGVHINSGIPNRAAFLISSNANVGLTKAGRIYFRALTRYLSPNSGFRDLRFKLAQAAKDLYGCSTGEVLAIRNSFNSVGITPSWRAQTACHNKTGCICSASVTTSDRSLFGSVAEAARLTATLYRTRDRLLVGPREYYRELFYENTSEIALLLLNNRHLRAEVATLLKDLRPGLNALVEGTGSEATVPESVTSRAAAIFDALIVESRSRGNRRLAAVIERETARIDVRHLSGMSYAEAWQQFYAPGEIDNGGPRPERVR